eukprot:2019391-Alexandrium_andersonii.AAC.1
MSASLVGSEMCIRDRLQRVWSSFLAPPAHRTCDLGLVRRVVPSGKCGGCLLYTSDAADDM